MTDDGYGEHEFIEIDGHRVDPRKVDRFFHADGRGRVSDEEWDEDRARHIAGLEGRLIVPLVVSDTPPEGDVIASYPEDIDTQPIEEEPDA